MIFLFVRIPFSGNVRWGERWASFQNFAYLRPQNHPTSVHKIVDLRLTFGDLCLKICIFELVVGKFGSELQFEPEPGRMLHSCNHVDLIAFSDHHHHHNSDPRCQNSCLSPLSSLGHFPEPLPSYSRAHITLSSSYSKFTLL